MNRKVLVVPAAIVLFVVFATQCLLDKRVPDPEDYKEAMREFVRDIGSYARGIKSSFILIPQNGHELVTKNGAVGEEAASEYLRAINGMGREDLFYGYNNDNEATPQSVRNEWVPFLDVAKAHGVRVLVIDYCSTQAFVEASYSQNAAKGYISFAAHQRELDAVPSYPAAPYNVNQAHINSLADAKNFLYLINPSAFSTKSAMLTAIQNTNYDLVIIDLFFNDGTMLTSADITSLKIKKDGGARLVIAYMSIGESEDYRYYWKPQWKTNPPPWLAAQNPNWPGNYKVRYWYKEWQDIIYGNDESYTKKILDAGFDGVYLDIIDAFEYFESQ